MIINRRFLKESSSERTGEDFLIDFLINMLQRMAVCAIIYRQRINFEIFEREIMKRIFAACLCIQFVLSGRGVISYGASADINDLNLNKEISSEEEETATGGAVSLNDETVSGGGILLNFDEHIPYAKTDVYNCFRPREAASRGETAAMLYELLLDKSGEVKTFDDVSENDEFYNEIGVICSKVIMTGRDDGLFHPEEGIKRGEFAAIICNIFGLEQKESGFADIYEGYWADGYIGAATEAGYMSGYENGLFMPQKEITRAEAVSAINRILGRGGCENAAELEGVLIMPDVVKTDWAYGDILEATTSHTYESTDGKETWLTYEKKTLELDYGFVNLGELLFYVDGNAKQYVANTTLGSFTYDENGRYTTGNTELDDYVSSIISKITDENMTKEQKLYACYVYMRDNFKYQKGTIYENGSSGWDVDEAVKIFSRGKGNCYSFASGFTHLARLIGYDAKPIAGQVPSASGGVTAHGWTEIAIDGATYIFDPELAMANGYDLFKKTYSQTPFTYYK